MVLDDSKPNGVAYEDEPGEGRYALKGGRYQKWCSHATEGIVCDREHISENEEFKIDN